jgi:hypothetical protein
VRTKTKSTPKLKPLDGVERIAHERDRQTFKLGYTAKHDDKHDDGDLAMVAACYASPETIYILDYDEVSQSMSFHLPFPNYFEDSRPRYADGALKDPTLQQRIRLLEKAGALIAAEIDRLLRLKP